MSILDWLLTGDKCVKYLTEKHLLGFDYEELRSELVTDGIIKEYLSKQDQDTGMWGNGVYSPKYISTHYTMLDLYNFEIDPMNEQYQRGANILLHSDMFVRYARKDLEYRDMCVGGMIGSMLTYGRVKHKNIDLFVDYVIKQTQKDGGWNCSDKYSEVSSIHTTLTILIFLKDYIKYGYSYRLDELKALIPRAQEYILNRELLYRLDNHELILKKIKSMPFPSKYQYDVLKSLEYFVLSGHPYDERMNDAIEYIISKQNKRGHWPITGNYTGLKHMEVEENNRDSRFNTFRILRILKAYRPELYKKFIN
jgi:uncharacterized protein YwbE